MAMGKRNSGVTFVIHLLHVDADRAARTRVGLVSFIAEVTGEKIRMTSHGTVAMTAVAFGFAQVKNERLIHVNAVLSTAAFCTAH